jgi:CRP-like cAMP-binding protein
MPIFAGMDGSVLAGWVEQAAVSVVAPGEFYFHEGDDAEAMYVLETGRVTLIREWAGAARRLGELGAGECFGEMALLDLFPRSASVLAVSPCTAIRLDTGRLYDLYTHHLDQFAQFQLNIARELSLRLRAADERLFRARIGDGETRASWRMVT